MSPALDLDLIRKYSVPGPRYTSYPPANRFTADFAGAALDEALVEDNGVGARPLSLYFHLPFCESPCWFCGCNTVVTRRREAAAEYLDDLEREMRLTARRMDRMRTVQQIHLGGGTPTFFPPDDLRRLDGLIREVFPHRAPDCEFGAEVDPRRLTPEHVQAFREMGVNRASLGVQDTNPQVQVALHRFQPMEMNERAFAWLREAGITSINVDLIYGLPLQSRASFARTIEDVLCLGPDRLSVFAYAHVPWVKPAQRALADRARLPDAEERLEMFATAHALLTEVGLVDIGLDHFARPDDALAVAQRAGTLQRNFQGYSTQVGASLYGFGISAISSTADTYRQNLKTLPQWRAALAADQLPVERGVRLSRGDAIRRTVIMRIMCDRRLDYRAISREIGEDFLAAFAPEMVRIMQLQEDKLVNVSLSGFEVTPRGVPLLRVIAMTFDATRDCVPSAHSRTV